MRCIALITMMMVSASLSIADDPLPTLDELLGIAETTEGVVEESNPELDRVLTQQEAGEEFEQVVDLMDQVARRIVNDQDIGIDTQRIQESIIDKLEKIIASAQDNSNSSSSSSSSQGSPQEQPNQQQSPQESPSESSGEGTDQQSAPELKEGDLADAQAPSGAGWGNLPQRVRESLTQGLNDTYSELYRKLTEEYYKALAEDDE